MYFPQALQMNNYLLVNVSFWLLFVTYLWTFLICYLGNRVTAAFENLSLSIYMSNWQSFPLEVKKCIPQMLLLSQRPVYMRGFNNFHCTLPNFGRVYWRLVTFLFEVYKWNISIFCSDRNNIVQRLRHIILLGLPTWNSTWVTVQLHIIHAKHALDYAHQMERRFV